MTAKLFETALGIAEPWSVASVDFDEATKVLTILIDFLQGSRFPVSGHEGVHPVHDTVSKTYRHLPENSISTPLTLVPLNPLEFQQSQKA